MSRCKPVRKWIWNGAGARPRVISATTAQAARGQFQWVGCSLKGARAEVIVGREEVSTCYSTDAGLRPSAGSGSRAAGEAGSHIGGSQTLTWLGSTVAAATATSCAV